MYNALKSFYNLLLIIVGMAIMVVVDLHITPLTGESKNNTDIHLYHHPHMTTPFTLLLHQTTPSILMMNHHISPIVSNKH